MKKKAILIILLFLGLGLVAGSYAGEKKHFGNLFPERLYPVKNAARSVVGIWDRETLKASITGVYGDLKGPISIVAAGVVMKKENEAVTIVTVDSPQKPATIEFLQDRVWEDMSLDRLIRERTIKVNNMKRLENGLVSLSIKVDKVPIFKSVKPVEIGERPTESKERNVFMILNFFGRPELCVWGKLIDGYFIEESGLAKSFAVLGTPVFNKNGRLIGLLRENHRLVSVSRGVLNITEKTELHMVKKIE